MRRHAQPIRMRRCAAQPLRDRMAAHGPKRSRAQRCAAKDTIKNHPLVGRSPAFEGRACGPLRQRAAGSVTNHGTEPQCPPGAASMVVAGRYTRPRTAEGASSRMDSESNGPAQVACLSTPSAGLCLDCVYPPEGVRAVRIPATPPEQGFCTLLARPQIGPLPLPKFPPFGHVFP